MKIIIVFVMCSRHQSYLSTFTTYRIENIRLTCGLLSVLIFIYMADFSCKMNNKRII